MKDSFILYTEQKEIIDKLTDEQAGKLIKAIYEYSSTGVMPKMDTILDIVIIPIKQSLDKNAKKYEKIVQRNKDNINKRWNTKNTTGKTGKITNTKNTDNDNDNEYDNDNNKKKIIKEKIHFAEFVSMTNAEYEKLVSTRGKEFADQCIEVLDNYKGSSGKKYKDDYRAILSWVVDRVSEDRAKKQAKPIKRNENNFDSKNKTNLNSFYANQRKEKTNE